MDKCSNSSKKIALNRLAKLLIFSLTLFHLGLLNAKPIVKIKSPLRIAILPIQTAKRIPSNIAKAAEKSILDRFVQESSWKILERERLNAIQSELGLQQSGLIAPKQIQKIGKMLAANKLLVGSLESVKNGYLLNLRIVDVEKALVDYSVKSNFNHNASIEEESSDLADRLVRKMTGRSQIRSYYTSLVPGWTQLERGQDLWGLTFAIGNSALLAAHIQSHQKHSKAETNYEDLLMPILIAKSAGPNAAIANYLYINPLKNELNKRAKMVNITGFGLAFTWAFNFIHGLWLEPSSNQNEATALFQWSWEPSSLSNNSEKAKNLNPVSSRIFLGLTWRLSL